MTQPSPAAMSAGIKTPKAEALLRTMFEFSRPLDLTAAAEKAGYHGRSGYSAGKELVDLGYLALVGRNRNRYTYQLTPAGRDAWMLIREELAGKPYNGPIGDDEPTIHDIVTDTQQPDPTPPTAIRLAVEAEVWDWVNQVSYTDLGRLSRNQLQALVEAIRGVR